MYDSIHRIFHSIFRSSTSRWRNENENVNDPRVYYIFVFFFLNVNTICVKLNRDTSRYDRRYIFIYIKSIVTPSSWTLGAIDEITSDDNIFARKKLGLLWISALQRAARVLLIGARWLSRGTIKIEKNVFII